MNARFQESRNPVINSSSPTKSACGTGDNIIKPLSTLILLILVLTVCFALPIHFSTICVGYSLVIAILMGLKFWEQIECIKWTLKYGDTFRRSYKHSDVKDEEDFKALLTNKKVEGKRRWPWAPFPFFPGNTWGTRWIENLRRKPGVVSKLIGITFRYPSLMVAGSALNMMSCYQLTHPWLPDAEKGFWIKILLLNSQILTLLLAVGLLIEVIHLILYRYTYGALDNILSGEYVGGSAVQAYQVPLPGYVALRRLLLIFGITFFVMVISYGALYFAMYSDVAAINSFHVDQTIIRETGQHIPKDKSPVWLQMLYFSATTLTTVGFGDIHPVGWLSKLLVVSQMSMGFSLLVLLLTAFVASLDPSETADRPSG